MTRYSGASDPVPGRTGWSKLTVARAVAASTAIPVTRGADVLVVGGATDAGGAVGDVVGDSVLGKEDGDVRDAAVPASVAAGCSSIVVDAAPVDDRPTTTGAAPPEHPAASPAATTTTIK
jgi:hypothetical protein